MDKKISANVTEYLRRRRIHGEPPQVADDDLFDAARRFDLSPAEVVRISLASGLTPQRYQRSVMTYGLEGQLELAQSTAAIVGAGGLGGHLIEILARTGLGRLIVADGDAFDPTNLNRQVLSTVMTLGRKKAEVAKERVALINPLVEITAHTTVLTSENIRKILGDADVIVDALDNIPDRFLLEKTAARMGVPYVFGAVAGFMGQVMTIFPGDPGLDRLYGPSGDASRTGAETVVGVPGVTPALVAARQASEVIHVLLGKHESLLRGRLWVTDLTGGRTTLVNVA